MKEKWSLSGTGWSVKTESGEIVFEYSREVGELYSKWLDYAEYVCDLHNNTLDT